MKVRGKNKHFVGHLYRALNTTIKNDKLFPQNNKSNCHFVAITYILRAQILYRGYQILLKIVATKTNLFAQSGVYRILFCGKKFYSVTTKCNFFRNKMPN